MQALLVASAVGYTIFSSHIRTNNWPRLTVLRCDIKNISHFFKGQPGHGVAIVLFLLLYRGTSCNPTSSFSDKIVTPACSLVNKSLSNFVEKHFES